MKLPNNSTNNFKNTKQSGALKLRVEHKNTDRKPLTNINTPSETRVVQQRFRVFFHGSIGIVGEPMKSPPRHKEKISAKISRYKKR
jgi:hypothetical protein